jgi:hypothetical protein
VLRYRLGESVYSAASAVGAGDNDHQETEQILDEPEGLPREHRALIAVDRIVDAYRPRS